jgi:hypothetical protein
MTEKKVCGRRCLDSRGWNCGKNCDCECHEAYKMCGLCHGHKFVEADPLNDHVTERIRCPKCGGSGAVVKDGYEVIRP